VLILALTNTKKNVKISIAFNQILIYTIKGKVYAKENVSA